jgi:hypothetical protein
VLWQVEQWTLVAFHQDPGHFMERGNVNIYYKQHGIKLWKQYEGF